MAVAFYDKFSSDISNLLIFDDEFNVTIEVGQAPNNQVFKAHSIILSSRCPYFKNKLHTMTYNEYNFKTIKRNDISVEVFDIIIRYIYNGAITLKSVKTSVMFDLLITSNEFGLEELVKYVQTFLAENNNSWIHLNFFYACQISFKDNNFEDLKKFCTNVITRQPAIIFDADKFITLPESILVYILRLDDLQLDEGNVWDYVIKWGIAQISNLTPNPEQWTDENFLTMKNTLKNCLPLVRYFSIAGDDVFKKVRPYRKILDVTLWEDLTKKFMAPSDVITSTILPPRNILHKDNSSTSSTIFVPGQHFTSISQPIITQPSTTNNTPISRSVFWFRTIYSGMRPYILVQNPLYWSETHDFGFEPIEFEQL
ncbi:hypothetical protein C2G38_2139711 [Gigaspora rosea]|uniref:BTB domain-containing protein n=1 Tax=Gigaspora rosea TaxID=44941 RepID=A0A397VU73_9GLOM|nr:hypothetical protein C2G38_2139711 [Gigaspora rosea]